MSPYGIANETSAITAKMERCVRDVIAGGIKSYKGRSEKESAIAICKSRIMKSRNLSKAMERKK